MKQTPSIQFDETCGQYYVRLQVDGIRKRFWLGSCKKDAVANLKDTLKNIATGKITFTVSETTATTTPDGVRDMRLEELAHKYLVWVQQNLALRTYITRRYSIQAFIKYIGPAMVSQLTRIQLSDFYAWARQHHSRGPNGGNHHLRDVRTMLRWAEEYEVCDNPIHRFPKIHHTPPTTRRFDDGDMVKLLQRIPAGTLRDMLLFGLLTGMRPQEVRELAPPHVIRSPDGHFHLCVEQHKTAKMVSDPVPRTVPLSAEAHAIIRRQVEQHPSANHVFLTEDGTIYSADVFRRSMERWCHRAGITQRTPYALRHTFASRQADSNTNLVSLGQLMGHTSTKTTARYISSSQEHHRQVIDRNAESILALVAASDEKSKDGQKVASKVASNSFSKKGKSGCVVATACATAR